MHPSSVLFLVASLLASATTFGWIDPPKESATAGAVDPVALHQFIAERRQRIPEFQTLKRIAESHGLNLWLWGGTAASFLHDSRWHLLAKAHPEQFLRGRLRDDLEAIFRSAQDFDLATNGTTAQAHALQRAFEAAMPGLKYEVRSFIEADGDKDPLLSANVLDQHSDTGSRGLIRLTDGDDAVVTDLLAWRDALPESEFLRDGAAATLQYLVSPNHRNTRPYREGRNPELLSVVRFLIKACQFDLRIPPASWEALVVMSKPFHTQEIPAGRARDWLLRQGRKVVMHALDMRRSFALLDALGLREVLLRLDPKEGFQTLRYWLTRRPLRSLPRPNPREPYPTAASVRLTQIAHDSKSLEAREAITWNPTGAPNFFISEQGSERREGVYALRGETGLYNNGFTVQLDVQPTALVGHDILDDPRELIIHHRDALRLAPVELTNTVDSWLEPQAFLQQMTRAYALTGLQRRVANGVEPVAPATRERALALFTSVLDFIPMGSVPELGGEWDKYLHFLYWVASPHSAKVLEQRLAKLEENPNPHAFHLALGVWRKAFTDVPTSVGIEQVVARMNACVDKTLATIADDSIGTASLIAWHIYLRDIVDPKRQQRLHHALLEKAVERALALPRSLHGDPSSTAPFHSFANGFQEDIDKLLFANVAPTEIAARLVTRKLFTETRDGREFPPLKLQQRADFLARGGEAIFRNFEGGQGLKASDLFELTDVRWEFWQSLLPILEANPLVRDRVLQLFPKLLDVSLPERMRKLLSAVVEAPDIVNFPAGSWAFVQNQMDVWLKESAFKSEYIERPETKALLTRWLRRLEEDLPVKMRIPVLRTVTEWYGRNYLRALAEERFEAIYRAWPVAGECAAEAIFVGRWPTTDDQELQGYAGYYVSSDARSGARKALASMLAVAIQSESRAIDKNETTVAEEFLVGLLSETGSEKGGDYWRIFPACVSAADRLFGASLRRHLGLAAIGPDFTHGAAHLREGTFAMGQAIRAMVALHGWDYWVNPVGPDRIDRVWRRLLHFRHIVPHMERLLMPAIEKAHLEPSKLKGWRKALNRAATAYCAEEVAANS